MRNTIVVAWVEMTGMEATGRMVERDRNWFPEFRCAPEAKAVVWLRRGTAADVIAAKQFAEAQEVASRSESPAANCRYSVFTYLNGTKDPLQAARESALARYGVTQ